MTTPRRFLRPRFLLVPTLTLAACATMASGSRAEETKSNATVDDSVVYKTVNKRELRIDWTRPSDWKSDDSRSAVVFIHGGGWTGGEPGQFSQHSVELAQRGCVCFRVEYRLLDKKKSLPPITCTEDVSDAFRFVRGNADKFGIDPNRIAAGGGSAGGHLASFLGMMDDKVKDGVSRKPNALLLFNPVYDNGPNQWGEKRVAGRVKEFSPAHNIDADDPPAVVFLGTQDKLIPVATAERFRDKMKAAGVASELHLYEGQGHGFFNANRDGGKHYRKTVDKMMAFLDRLGWFKQSNSNQ